MNAALSVCKIENARLIPMSDDLLFIGKTDRELSLVCKTESVPTETLAREDGWRAFRITGTLDFSLIGILARIAAVLAEEQIGIFVVSTFDTDYILVKEQNAPCAERALMKHGYFFVNKKAYAL